MQESIMQQGLDLMLFGMGTVFVFLTILVFATVLMSKLVTRFFPESSDEPLVNLASPSTPATSVVDPKVISVIQEAINQHRSGR